MNGPAVASTVRLPLANSLTLLRCAMTLRQQARTVEDRLAWAIHCGRLLRQVQAARRELQQQRG